MGNKTPKPPLPLARHGPHLIQQCLGSPRPKFAPKVGLPLPVDRSANPHYISVSSLDPSDLSCQTASGSDSPFFPQCIAQTDAPTDARIDRPRKSLITIGRCAPRATRPNNTIKGNSGFTFFRKGQSLISISGQIKKIPNVWQSTNVTICYAYENIEYVNIPINSSGRFYMLQLTNRNSTTNTRKYVHTLRKLLLQH